MHASDSTRAEICGGRDISPEREGSCLQMIRVESIHRVDAMMVNSLQMADDVVERSCQIYRYNSAYQRRRSSQSMSMTMPAEHYSKSSSALPTFPRNTPSTIPRFVCNVSKLTAKVFLRTSAWGERRIRLGVYFARAYPCPRSRGHVRYIRRQEMSIFERLGPSSGS